MTQHGSVQDTDTAMVPAAGGALSPLVDSPLPVFTGAQMLTALKAYQDLQRALDDSMPDQIMELDGRKFRKKGYWRAIAVAFNLTVEILEERRDVSGTFNDGRENFGYIVSAKVTAPNGRSIVSDGSCFAIEKARRFKCPHPHPSWKGKTAHFPHHTCPDFDPNFQWRILPADATEHNVRSHAHTRAFNRAVSNLVGFGEVSAEEVVRDGREEAEAPASAATASAPAAARAPIAQPQARPAAPASGGPVISEPQAKRFYAIAKKAGHDDGGKAWLKHHYGLDSDRQIPRAQYEAIVYAVQSDDVPSGDRDPGGDDQ